LAGRALSPQARSWGLSLVVALAMIAIPHQTAPRIGQATPRNPERETVILRQAPHDYPMVASNVARKQSSLLGRGTSPGASPKSDLLIPSFGILLGLVLSVEDGQDWWTELARLHEDLLGSLRPRLYEAARSSGQIIYGVVGGPFDSRAGAAAACAELAERQVDCSVVIYRGMSPSALEALSLASDQNGSAEHGNSSPP
jgi:hypothetical protein